MAKITISLPDPLKDRLEQYAQEHELAISQAVQKALEALLEAPHPEPPPPAPPSSSGPPPNLEIFLHIEYLQRYVSALADHHELLRDCVAAMAPFVETPEGLGPFPFPGELPPPPWSHA